MTVLVISHWFDPTSDHVIEELNRRRVPVFRFDVADFPQHLHAAAALDGTSSDSWRGKVGSPDREVCLSEVSGILYRRPTAFAFSDELGQQERRWATEEARLGFGGLLASFGTWLNHPHRVAFAEYKPVQLQLAVQCGLTVPKTIITNDPDQALEFCDRMGEVIYKPLSPETIVENGQSRSIYATRVPRADFGHPDVRHTAHLFQEWVEHDYAVRVAVVDDQYFATAIHAHSGAAHTDWRRDFNALSYESVSIPADVRRGIGRLMSRLGLRFGALDFLVRPDGSYVYLETNPNGQWAWIEQTAPAIASALADALVRGPSGDCEGAVR